MQGEDSGDLKTGNDDLGNAGPADESDQCSKTGDNDRGNAPK